MGIYYTTYFVSDSAYPNKNIRIQHGDDSPFITEEDVNRGYYKKEELLERLNGHQITNSSMLVQYAYYASKYLNVKDDPRQTISVK